MNTEATAIAKINEDAWNVDVEINESSYPPGSDFVKIRRMLTRLIAAKVPETMAREILLDAIWEGYEIK